MGADSIGAVLAAAGYAGVDLGAEQVEQLETYHAWLRGEALVAGGIGPNEEHRLWSRHIADSLVFGYGFGGTGACLDVGSGVGLPGIPLAIAYPATAFVLVDRSRRRTDLARRASLILGLENCRVVNLDIRKVEDKYERLVSRAAMPPEELMIHVKRLLAPGGVAHIGLSTSAGPSNLPEKSDGLRITLLRIPARVLDTDTTLLRIEAT